ncbi:MAG TPA: hypothetical protein VFS18_01890 [Actinomycetota bacterium]|nr:hypothetical protein [Actinomycetota bacterium]
MRERVRRIGRRRNLAVAVATVALVAALPTPAPAAVSASCRGADSMFTDVRSFTIETRWSKRVYRRGDTVKVEVTVTRPGQKDPLNNGIELNPPVTYPAEGVNVTTTVVQGFPYPYGGGVTDADGKVVIKITLPRNVKGKVMTSTEASLVHNQGGPACSEVREVEFKQEYPAFIVR